MTRDCMNHATLLDMPPGTSWWLLASVVLGLIVGLALRTLVDYQDRDEERSI